MKGLTPNELIQWQPPKQSWIISSNILVTQGTMMVYGKEETWKSMLVGLDMAFKIATGQPWFGYKTIASSIYNFQTEIPQNFLRDRMIKYMTGNKVTASNIWFASELYMKVDRGWGFAELEKEVIRTQPKVVVVDNISSSTATRLTEDWDTGEFLSRMDLLRSKYKVAIILIHHTRIAEHSEGQTFHYGTDEAFGSSRFPRWLDTIIYIDKVEDNENTGLVTLHLDFEKTRHSEQKVKPMDIIIDRSNLVFQKGGT